MVFFALGLQFTESLLCTYPSGVGSLPDGEFAHGIVAEHVLCVPEYRQSRQTHRIGVRPVLVALALSALDQVGQHDNPSHLLLPYHPPEIAHRVPLGTLARDIRTWTFVALGETNMVMCYVIPTRFMVVSWSIR